MSSEAKTHCLREHPDALWEKTLANAEMGGDDDAIALVNRLGNCTLLEKNFNISKSDKGLKSFLTQIHEVIQKKIRIDAWCAALEIPQPMLDPSQAAIKDITEAIENRDKEIRSDLIDFVRGTRVRVDVSTPAPPKPTAATPPQEATLEPTTPPSPEVKEQITTTPAQSGTDVAGLRSAYVEDPGVRVIVDHFAGRQYNQNVTELDALRTKLERNGTLIDKPDLIRALRRMDALGVGRFLVGRRGQATRFEWHEKSLAIRKLATGESSAQPVQ